MAKSLEQTIMELADREQIRELPQRYCDCVWRGDVDGIVKLFADEGVFTIVGHQREKWGEIDALGTRVDHRRFVCARDLGDA